MSCSTSVQIYKSYGGLRVFVSSVEIEQYDSVSQTGKFSRT
jgi:hypothetical protein